MFAIKKITEQGSKNHFIIYNAIIVYQYLRGNPKFVLETVNETPFICLKIDCIL